MLLFLIGLPGSGKTTLGKQLASLLTIPFIDLDKEIVKHYGLTIKEIFEEQGEAAFREMESTTLRNLADKKPLIIATGGGAPCFHNNMEWMNANGTTLFLNPPLNELASRLSVAKNNHRPMLKNFTLDETLAFLEQKEKERSPYYSLAQLSLNVPSPNVDHLKKLLIDQGLIQS